MPTRDNVRILHANRFGYPEQEGIREVYTYTTEMTDLEQIWRWNNVVDGSEVPARQGHRSLSVGDIVGVLDFESGDWTYHKVKRIGWDKLSPLEVDQLLEKGREFDPFAGL